MTTSVPAARPVTIVVLPSLMDGVTFTSDTLWPAPTTKTWGVELIETIALAGTSTADDTVCVAMFTVADSPAWTHAGEVDSATVTENDSDAALATGETLCTDPESAPDPPGIWTVADWPGCTSATSCWDRLACTFIVPLSSCMTGVEVVTDSPTTPLTEATMPEMGAVTVEPAAAACTTPA